MRAGAVLVLLLATAASVNAQASPGCAAEAEQLVSRVRDALAPYPFAEDAVADGYRRIGQEFPAMGEHWISLKEATLDRFDPAHPSILLFASRNGKLEVVGAAFTALLDPGEEPPGPKYLKDLWHEHLGTLEEELFTGDHAAHSADAGFKVLVLHVWTAVPNPAGPFHVENWSLPYYRAGTDDAGDALLARALSLAYTPAYYATSLHTLGVPYSEAQAIRVQEVVERHSREARSVLETRASRMQLSGTEANALKATWRRFISQAGSTWPDIAARLGQLERDMEPASACR